MNRYGLIGIHAPDPYHMQKLTMSSLFHELSPRKYHPVNNSLSLKITNYK